MRVILNQSHPLVNGSFKSSSAREDVTPKFSFKYYESDIDYLRIYSFGSIGIHRVDFVGQIEILIPGIQFSESEILDEKELLAVRWFRNITDNGT
ncbi:unnamed protein product, partial [Schistosoma curassoni]|uniref:Bact_transglu_N domain-containing protein n=1 Tax=Schistosoma curassoni TaxID=6186 RepID=A0A183JKC8_9TREM